MDTYKDEEIRRVLHHAIDGFFDRIGGASTKPETDDTKHPSLPQMLQRLSEVDDATWGRYVLANDLLHAKVPQDEANEMVARAQECGRTWAQSIRGERPTADPDEVARDLGVSVGTNPALVSSKRVLFAQFVPDDHIDLMEDPLSRYAQLRKKLLSEESGDAAREELESLLPTSHLVRSLLLSHELFHVIEDRNESSIYTRTAKIALWKFLGFENRSTLRALGEIGAGAFAQELNGALFCPFALDILLTWAYDTTHSEALYDAVLACERVH